jgi:hypothetical protein
MFGESRDDDMEDDDDDMDEMDFNERDPDFCDEYGRSLSKFLQENIPNLLNEMNDQDPDAFYSKVDESNAFSEYNYNNEDMQHEEFKVNSEVNDIIDVDNIKFSFSDDKELPQSNKEQIFNQT